MTTTGRVTGLQRSPGGVPKVPVQRAMMRVDGMEGDRQANRKYHGGPERALCLYAQERLDALASEGHPLTRGTLGENVTIAGLRWEEVQPGVRLQVGSAQVEVTGFAAPCRQIAGCFADRRFGRVGEKAHRGWSRVYARVLTEGEVRVGDAVMLCR